MEFETMSIEGFIIYLVNESPMLLLTLIWGFLTYIAAKLIFG